VQHLVLGGDFGLQRLHGSQQLLGVRTGDTVLLQERLAGGLDLLGAGLFTQGVQAGLEGLGLRMQRRRCRQRLRGVGLRAGRGGGNWRLGGWRGLLGKRAERQQQAEQQGSQGKTGGGAEGGRIHAGRT